MPKRKAEITLQMRSNLHDVDEKVRKAYAEELARQQQDEPTMLQIQRGSSRDPGKGDRAAA